MARFGRTWLRSLLRRKRRAGTQLRQIGFQTPAKGDTFEFSVTAHCEWSSTTLTGAALDARIATHEPAAREAVESTVRPVARQHEPAEAMLVEATANERLAAGWWFDEGTVRMCARIRVASDDNVSEPIRDLRQRLLALHADHAVAMQRVEYVDQQFDRWQQVLTKVGADRIATLALRLAIEPDAAASLVAGMAAERKVEIDDLVATLKEQIRQHRQLSDFDSALSTEAAWRALLKLQGIPDPGVALDELLFGAAASDGGNGAQKEA